eukprot:UN08304
MVQRACDAEFNIEVDGGGGSVILHIKDSTNTNIEVTFSGEITGDQWDQTYRGTFQTTAGASAPIMAWNGHGAQFSVIPSASLILLSLNGYGVARLGVNPKDAVHNSVFAMGKGKFTS